MKKLLYPLVLLMFLVIPVSCFAKEESSDIILGSAETDEMSFELISLSEGPEGGLNGVLRCTNPKDQASSVRCSRIFVNDVIFYVGTGFSGIWTSSIPSKESLDVEFSITELFSPGSSDSSGEDDEAAMSLKDPIGFLEISEIKSLSFVVNADDPENEFVTIDLTKPVPYQSFADLSEGKDTVTVFEDDRFCMRLERIGIIEEGITLSVIAENKTDQKQTYYLDGAVVNDETYFEPGNVNLSTFDLYAGSKGQRYVGLTPFEGFRSPFTPGPDGEEQSLFNTMRFSILYENPETGEIERSNVMISLPEPLELEINETEGAESAAIHQGKKEAAAKEIDVSCEKEGINLPPVFEMSIGLPEDAGDQRESITLTFNEALTEDDYNSFVNVFAVIQLRSTDPEWLKDNEDCMLVRPLAKVKMHPDGEGGLAGIYSGLVLNAGEEHFIIPLIEDGSGEEILKAESGFGLTLNTDECFRILEERHSAFTGVLRLNPEIHYQENKALLADYSVTGERNKAEVDLTDWPVSRFSQISNGISAMYQYWQPDENGFYDTLTSFEYHEGDLIYPTNHVTVPLNFVPYTEVIGENDVVTVSYEFIFTDGSTLRINLD